MVDTVEVPREPTDEMVVNAMSRITGGSTFNEEDRQEIARDVWFAMLAASPVSHVGGQGSLPAAPTCAEDIARIIAPLTRAPVVAVTSLDGKVKEPLVCLTVPEREAILALIPPLEDRSGEGQGSFLQEAKMPGGDAADGAGQWQDISTAPKSTYRAMEFGNLVDAVYLLTFCPEEGADPDGCIEVVWWEPLDKGGKGCWTNGHFDCHPTHWRPLPSPPVPSVSGEGGR